MRMQVGRTSADLPLDFLFADPFVPGSLSDYIERSTTEGVTEDGLSYQTILFYPPHEYESLVVYTEDGKRQGEAILWEDGIKKLQWMYADGKRVGEFTVFHYGNHYISGWWNELGQWDGLSYLQYTPKESFLVQRHPVTGNIIYRGGMGANCLIREGYGVEFDAKTGFPLFFGIYVNNELIRIYQRFRDDKVMFEYKYEDDEIVNQLSGMELLQYVIQAVDAPRSTVFMGEYKEEDNWFVRVEELTNTPPVDVPQPMVAHVMMKPTETVGEPIKDETPIAPTEENTSNPANYPSNDLVPPTNELTTETPTETPFPANDAEGSVYSFDESLEESDSHLREEIDYLPNDADYSINREEEPPEVVEEKPVKSKIVSVNQIRLAGFDPRTMKPETYTLDDKPLPPSKEQESKPANEGSKKKREKNKGIMKKGNKQDSWNETNQEDPAMEGEMNSSMTPDAPSFTPSVPSYNPVPQTFTPSVPSFAPSAQASFTPSAQSFTPAPPQQSFTPSGPSFTPSAQSFTPSAPSFTPSGPSFTPAGSSFAPSAPSFTPAGSSFTPSGPSFAPAPPQQSFAPSGPSFTPSGPSFTPAGSSFAPSAPSFTPAQPQHSSSSPIPSFTGIQEKPTDGYIIRTELDYANINKEARAVIIEDSCCCEGMIWKFEFADNPKLEDLWIGKQSLMSIGEFNVYNLPNLRRLVLNDGCLSGDSAIHQNRRVNISGLNELEEIVIGENVAEKWEDFFVLSKCEVRK